MKFDEFAILHEKKEYVVANTNHDVSKQVEPEVEAFNKVQVQDDTLVQSTQGDMHDTDCAKPGMDILKSNSTSRILVAALLLTVVLILFKLSPDLISPNVFSRQEPAGVTHVLVTGGAGYIGSHAALRLLKDSYHRVTIVDNLSRGNMGAVKILQKLFPEPGRLQFIYADLGDAKTMPINPYGKAKKMSEDIIIDFSKTTNMAVMILRYFNVIGSDPDGRLGEAPRPELREHGRISGACFDAARGITPGLKVRGTDYKTVDGTCVRDYIDVTDLVDAHVLALANAKPGKVGIYNVGTGKGRSVKEFVEACKKATGVDIKVDYLSRRPGDYAEVFSDPSKIRDELNWTARRTDLQESLEIAWKWQKAHLNCYGPSMA
ncbi:hypothetical protein LWI29_030755 [Acer saccharum]|uniref:NAD(P)-binding domain-containing protein n=1 Tax=Acer saccharum TaxID=4024 RepID=A0AA39VM22_ACESA|nr:hypothetical protein LWI29_030755 [Acer saccharum]